MTAVEHARAILEAKARSKPWTAWDDLPAEKREALVSVAERLQLHYAAAGDAPSMGMR